MPKNLSLHEPQRQNPLGVAVMFFRNLRIGFNIFLSVIVVQFGTQSGFWGMSLYTIGGIIAALFLVLSYFQYRRFFFYVEEDKFILEKGVLKRDKLTIAFDRIQSVNLTENLIQQVLGVTALKVDTAGSAANELEIPALDKQYARSLQEQLLALKREHSDEAEENDSPEESTKQLSSVDAQESPLLKLGLRDVIRVGLTENHLRSGLILFAVINGYVWQFEDYILKPFQRYIDSATDTVLAYGLIILPISILLFLIIGVLFSLIQSVLKFYNLRFFANKSGVRMVSGLLKRAEYHIPENKIQYIKWSSNPLRKWIGYKTITVKQAGSEATVDSKSLTIPGAREEQLQRVLDYFFAERRHPSQSHSKSHWLLASQLSFFFSALIGLAFGLGGLLHWALWWFIPFLIPIFILLSVLYAKSVSLSFNGQVFELHKGYIFPRRYFIHHYKLQNVRFSQSVFQKRRQLAHLTLHTAAGSKRMPHMPAAEAKRLYDLILFEIERSKRTWM